MAANTEPKKLSVALVLADLSELQAADSEAASALLNVNKTLDHQLDKKKSNKSLRPERPRFDRWGRRIPSSSSSATRSSTPALSRAESTASDVSKLLETDEDSERARTLIELYESRGRIGDLPMAGLRKSRERIAAIAEKYAEVERGRTMGEK